jgi:hypothetical protein
MSHEPLIDKFLRARTSPIEFEGSLAYASYGFLSIPNGSRLVVRRLSSRGDREQGLHVSCKDGKVAIAESVERHIILWEKSAPDVATLEVRARSKSGEVDVFVWNAWQEGSGPARSSLGNAAMRVSGGDEGEVLLHCSDGEGDVSFDDLVVGVKVLRPSS